MKSLLSLLISVLVSASLFGSPNHQNIQDNKNTNLTYQGTTEDNQYKFIDDKKKVFLFNDIDYEIEINLYDDEYIGRTFTITWEEETEEVYDDEDEPTGQTIITKRILAIEEQS